MTIEYRRIARASLESPMDDGGDRNIMPMQTLIGVDAEPPNHMWLLECAWDGMAIGDIQVFRNQNAIGDGSSADTDGNGEPVAPAWVWWGGVPRGKVKSYRFAGGEDITPRTLTDGVMPFELPKSHAERETKSRSPGEGSRRGGAGEERG